MVWANSDVLFVVRLVAVAEIAVPNAAWYANVPVLDTAPVASVVTKTKPRKVLPSPNPDESAVGLANSSIRKVVFGVLTRVKLTVMDVPPTIVAEVTVGKFCRVFAPLSASVGSF